MKYMLMINAILALMFMIGIILMIFALHIGGYIDDLRKVVRKWRK